MWNGEVVYLAEAHMLRGQRFESFFHNKLPFVAPDKLIINNLKFFKYEKSN